MTSLTKNPHPQSKKFVFECRLEGFPRLWDFHWICRAYRTGEIHTQSHVRLGIFFQKSLKVAGGQSVKEFQWFARKHLFGLHIKSLINLNFWLSFGIGGNCLQFSPWLCAWVMPYVQAYAVFCWNIVAYMVANRQLCLLFTQLFKIKQIYTLFHSIALFRLDYLMFNAINSSIMNNFIKIQECNTLSASVRYIRTLKSA